MMTIYFKDTESQPPPNDHSNPEGCRATPDRVERVDVQSYRIADTFEPGRSSNSENALSKKRINELETTDSSPEIDAGPLLKRKRINTLEVDQERNGLNGLLDNLCEHSLTIIQFLERCEALGLQIVNPDIFAAILNHLRSENQIELVGDLLIQLTHKQKIPTMLVPSIIQCFGRFESASVVKILTKNGVEFGHYRWSDEEQRYVPADFFVPLFLLANFKNVSIEMTKEFVKQKKFDLVSSLVLSERERVKWVCTPFGIIESLPLLESLQRDYERVPQIQDLLNTRVFYFGQETTLSEFVAQYRDFSRFKSQLERTKTHQELIVDLLRDAKVAPMALTPLGFFYLIPILTVMLGQGNQFLEEIHLFMSRKTQGDLVILKNPVLFKIALPFFEALIETKNWQTLHKLLSSTQRKGITPLFSTQIFCLSISILDKLLENGQFAIFCNLLSQENDVDNTPMHYHLNLPDLMPLLIKLVQMDQLGIITDLLTKANSAGHTPLHICKNIFWTLKPLISELIEKNAFETIQKIFSARDERNNTPLNYNEVNDTAMSAEHLVRLVGKNQFKLVQEFLSIADENKNTLIHNAKIFPSMICVFVALIENDQFEIVNNLLTAKNMKNQTPLHLMTHYEGIQLIFQKLNEQGQGNLVQRLERLRWKL